MPPLTGLKTSACESGVALRLPPQSKMASGFGEAVELAGAVGDGVVVGAGAGEDAAEVGPGGEAVGGLQPVADGIGIPCEAHGRAGGRNTEVEDGRRQGGVGLYPSFNAWFTQT